MKECAEPPAFDHPWPALDHAVATWPQAEALVFPHLKARLTFADWRSEALRVAGGLRALGLAPGDHIALLAENRAEWPIVQMACAALGAVVVPLNTHFRKDDLGYALRQSDAKAVILSREFRGNPYLDHVEALRPELPLLRHVLCLDEAAWSGLGGAFQPPEGPDPAAVGALLYTSGTTGFPKGALLSHRAMMMDARQTTERLGVGLGDRWTSIIPLFHCAGCILNLLGCLQAGAAYVGVPSFDAELMFQTIAAERCTVLSGVPTSYLAMLDHPARGTYDLASLRAGTCGGADCDPKVLARCAADFPMPGLCQVYGQTEGATLFACPASDDPLRWATAGLPLPSHEIRVASPDAGTVLPPGALGEIQAKGPMVMAGYYKMPEASAESFTADGWLKTGDLGTLREDGRLVVAGGRLRDMIIRGGENIYPAEVENTLSEHPTVAAVAVFGIADGYYGEAVAAAVRLRGTASAAELRRHCAERIAKFKAPQVFYSVETFPQTSSGKIRKIELRRWAAERKLTELP